MKRVKHIALAAATLAMIGVTGSALAAPAATDATPAENGIASTKHNLSTTGIAGNNRATTGTTEICVFCHTPHASDTSQAVPLWNRELSAPGDYATYAQLGSATLDGTVADVGSVSLACLSCHDGTIAMDSLVNSPGSGTIPVTNVKVGIGYVFEGPSMSPAGLLLGGPSGTIAMLGTDLSNDHPVGVLYGGGGITTSILTSSNFNDSDFRDVKYVNINSGDYWYVDVDNNNKRTRTDMILYTRDEGDGAKPYVECASCHDPHVTAFTGTDQVAFLRVTNEDSNLCLACHIK